MHKSFFEVVFPFVLLSQLESCPINQLQFQVKIQNTWNYMNNSYIPNATGLEILPTISQNLISLGNFLSNLLPASLYIKFTVCHGNKVIEQNCKKPDRNWKLKQSPRTEHRTEDCLLTFSCRSKLSKVKTLSICLDPPTGANGWFRVQTPPLGGCWMVEK